MRKIVFALVAFLAAFLSSCLAVEEPTYLDKDGVPIPTNSYVNDFTGKILKSYEIDTLNSRLEEYEKSTTTQIVVIIMPTLPSQWGDIADLAFETGDRWKIGQEETDNGILLLILLDDRKMFIATGYGSEGALTDVICTRITQNNIAPHFKNEKYFEGISVGIEKIQLAMKGEYEKVAEEELKASNQKIRLLIWLFGMGVLLVILGSFTHPAVGGIAHSIGTLIVWKMIFGAIFSPVWAFLIVGGIVVLLVSFLVRNGAFSGGGGGMFSGSGGGGGGFSGGGGSFGGGGGGGGW